MDDRIGRKAGAGDVHMLPDDLRTAADMLEKGE